MGKLKVEIRKTGDGAPGNADVSSADTNPLIRNRSCAQKTFGETIYAAFLQNAKNVAGSIPRVCTLGWYAMPHQGMGSRRRSTLKQSEM